MKSSVNFLGLELDQLKKNHLLRKLKYGSIRGSKISIQGNTAYVEGNSELSAAPVTCTDLRASAALILAALVSKGETEIREIGHLERGYENIDKKLEKLGAHITKVGEK